MTDERRYQSRLIQGLWQKSLQLKEAWHRTARQAKVSTLWSMQFVLYPAYCLFQVARMTGRLLRQGDRQGKQVLRQIVEPEQASALGSSAETPLQRVLDAIQIEVPTPAQSFPLSPVPVQTAQLTVSIRTVPARRPPLWVRCQTWWTRWTSRWRDRSPQPLQANHRLMGSRAEGGCAIQGIASTLRDRHAVLVTSDNTVLDVLTPAQQLQLQQLCIWESASYRRQQRLVQSLQHLGKFRLPLALPAPKAHLLPPFRAFRQLMGWVQTGPLATRANVFHEAEGNATAASRTMVPGANFPAPALPNRLNALVAQLKQGGFTPAAVERLDQTVASWEATSWQWLGALTHNLSHQISQVLQRTQPPAASHHSPQEQALPSSGNSLLPNLLRPPLHNGLQALISVPPLLRTAITTLAGLPHQQPPPVDRVSTAAPLKPRDQPIAPSPTQSLLNSLQSWLNRTNAGDQAGAVGAATQSLDTAPVPGEGGTMSIEPAPAQPPAPRQSVESIATQTPTDVPVEAVVMGYEKHLLERILDGLDRIVAWVEAQLEKFWRQLWPVMKRSWQQLWPVMKRSWQQLWPVMKRSWQQLWAR